MRLAERATVAVIGSGASGALTALHLLADPDGPRVRLIERRACFARGAAYATTRPDHMLNVRAANMSAFPDDPAHFTRWLARNPDADGEENGAPTAFVTRRRFGAYLQDLLREATRRTEAGRLILDADEAVALVRDGAGWRLTFAMGRVIRVDAAVLAVGNLPPHAPPGVSPEAARAPGYFADPWTIDGEALPECGAALLLGTGLTMVDVALGLAERRPDGKIMAVSRRGLTPRRHLEQGPVAPPRPPADGSSVAAVMRDLRRAAQTQDWRLGIDGLRPHVQAIWRGWSLAERRRFLRHVRPWWDTHRHRLAPVVAGRLDHLKASGALATAAGRVTRVSPRDDGFDVEWTPRSGGEPRRIEVALVINCMGPNGDLTQAREGLLSGLAADGLIRADACRLGLDVDATGRLIGADGRPNPALFAVGPITRGAVWEMTSIPDIRQQARDCASAVCASVAATVA